MNFKSKLVVLCFILPAMLYSQTEVTKKLPVAKNVMFELNFNPLGGTGVFSFDNMQGKYWLNNSTVLRVGLGLTSKSNGVADSDYDSKEQYKPNINEKSTLFTFKPGIEFRLLKNSTISPYVGLELMYKNKSSNADYKEYTQTMDYNTQKTIYTFVDTKIDGSWRSYSISNGTYPYTTVSYSTERAFSTYGTNLLLGSDFYFVKNMYFGFEVGLGYQSTLYDKIIIDVSTNVDKTTTPSYSTSNLAFYYNSAIRLGVWF